MAYKPWIRGCSHKGFCQHRQGCEFSRFAMRNELGYLDGSRNDGLYYGQPGSSADERCGGHLDED